MRLVVRCGSALNSLLAAMKWKWRVSLEDIPDDSLVSIKLLSDGFHGRLTEVNQTRESPCARLIAFPNDGNRFEDLLRHERRLRIFYIFCLLRGLTLE